MEQAHIRTAAKTPLTTPNDPQFREEEVFDALKTMNPKKSPGQDNLTSDICYLFAQLFPNVLTDLILLTDASN